MLKLQPGNAPGSNLAIMPPPYPGASFDSGAHQLALAEGEGGGWLDWLKGLGAPQCVAAGGCGCGCAGGGGGNGGGNGGGDGTAVLMGGLPAKAADAVTNGSSGAGGCGGGGGAAAGGGCGCGAATGACGSVVATLGDTIDRLSQAGPGKINFSNGNLFLPVCLVPAGVFAALPKLFYNSFSPASSDFGFGAPKRREKTDHQLQGRNTRLGR